MTDRFDITKPQEKQNTAVVVEHTEQDKVEPADQDNGQQGLDTNVSEEDLTDNEGASLSEELSEK
jgi:hypothetical protein